LDILLTGVPDDLSSGSTKRTTDTKNLKKLMTNEEEIIKAILDEAFVYQNSLAFRKKS
jgi:hypothetical protein